MNPKRCHDCPPPIPYPVKETASLATNDTIFVLITFMRGIRSHPIKCSQMEPRGNLCA
jgi:hypothetical protein